MDVRFVFTSTNKKGGIKMDSITWQGNNNSVDLSQIFGEDAELSIDELSARLNSAGLDIGNIQDYLSAMDSNSNGSIASSEVTSFAALDGDGANIKSGDLQEYQQLHTESVAATPNNCNASQCFSGGSLVISSEDLSQYAAELDGVSIENWDQAEHHLNKFNELVSNADIVSLKAEEDVKQMAMNMIMSALMSNVPEDDMAEMMGNSFKAHIKEGHVDIVSVIGEINEGIANVVERSQSAEVIATAQRTEKESRGALGDKLFGKKKKEVNDAEDRLPELLAQNRERISQIDNSLEEIEEIFGEEAQEFYTQTTNIMERLNQAINGESDESIEDIEQEYEQLKSDYFSDFEQDVIDEIMQDGGINEQVERMIDIGYYISNSDFDIFSNEEFSTTVDALSTGIENILASNPDETATIDEYNALISQLEQYVELFGGEEQQQLLDDYMQNHHQDNLAFFD
jgi:hypothetical protein